MTFSHHRIVDQDRSLADEVQNKSVLIKALSAMSEAVKDPELAKEVKIEGFTLLR